MKRSKKGACPDPLLRAHVAAVLVAMRNMAMNGAMGMQTKGQEMANVATARNRPYISKRPVGWMLIAFARSHPD
eukprot:11770088-Alexandrium_andersonii.AAC.1